MALFETALQVSNLLSKPGHLYHLLVCYHHPWLGSMTDSWYTDFCTFKIGQLLVLLTSCLLQVLFITKWTLPNTIVSLFSKIPYLSSQWKASK